TNRVNTTSITMARLFNFLSWRRRSSTRRTGGVDEPDPGTLLMPDVAGPASEVGFASRVRTSSMADRSNDPDVLIPSSGERDTRSGGGAARGEGNRQVFDAVDEAREQAGGLA